jgi:cytidine deaminase
MKTKTLTSRYQEQTLDELSPQEQTLVRMAVDATNRSYAPYSHFAVGAALLLADGTIIPGCNQENAAFPAGICAERSAIFAAGASHPETQPVTLAIAARRLSDDTPMPQPRKTNEELWKELQETPVGPCGTCRQVIIETETRYRHPLRLLLVGRDVIYSMDSIKELMPLSFIDF